MVKELTAAEKAAAAEAKAAEKAAAKAEGPEIYIFPGDDAIAMNEVTYLGSKDEDGKEKQSLFVRVCGRGITLKKGVMVLMSKSCQITLGKIKQINVKRRAIG
jgi:hypothetical protein